MHWKYCLKKNGHFVSASMCQHFWWWGWNIPGKLGQHHGCWWPGSLHCQTWYWLHMINSSLSSVMWDFNYLCHLRFKKLHKMQKKKKSHFLKIKQNKKNLVHKKFIRSVHQCSSIYFIPKTLHTYIYTPIFARYYFLVIFRHISKDKENNAHSLQHSSILKHPMNMTTYIFHNIS